MALQAPAALPFRPLPYRLWQMCMCELYSAGSSNWKSESSQCQSLAIREDLELSHRHTAATAAMNIVFNKSSEPRHRCLVIGQTPHQSKSEILLCVYHSSTMAKSFVPKLFPFFSPLNTSVTNNPSVVSKWKSFQSPPVKSTQETFLSKYRFKRCVLACACHSPLQTQSWENGTWDISLAQRSTLHHYPVIMSREWRKS